MITAIAVVGAGAMGQQIAVNAALGGVRVNLTDNRSEGLDAARAFAGAYLDKRLAKGRISPEQKAQALSNLSYAPDLESAAGDVDLVIEAIVEQYQSKADLFRTLDRICRPDTIFGTNSSNILSSRLAEETTRPGRVLNIHYFNPATVMELVEIAIHPKVDQEVIDDVVEFCKRIGKTPVVLRKEISGFIVNRIFRALTREAMSLYEEGYASIEDIDISVTKGLRHPMGPFALLDMTGIDVSYLARQDEYDETGVESARPNRILKEMYERGDWGKKTGRGFYSYQNDNDD